MAISGRHFQFVQGADKNVKTDCVCSGAHCAAVGGFAALRMRRPLYGERAPCMLAIFAARILRREAFKFVIARRPNGPTRQSVSPVHDTRKRQLWKLNTLKFTPNSSSSRTF